MQTQQFYRDRIDEEFFDAQKARVAKNDGMVRVCERRAARHALSWYRTAHPDKRWAVDVIHQLEYLGTDTLFPSEIRHAAIRLAGKISDRFRCPFQRIQPGMPALLSIIS